MTNSGQSSFREEEKDHSADAPLNPSSTSNKNNTPKPSLTFSEGTPIPENAPQWVVAAHKRLQIKLETAKASGQSLFGVVPPPSVKRVLLHSCCAPCSGAMVEEMMTANGLETVKVFFYNPNIHPRKEYEIRKEENKTFCQKLGIDFVDVDYDVENWYARVKGMEFDPERGRRCTECFDMRMERTALYAHEHGFDAIATTNSTSRWKDEDQVDDSGDRAAAKYSNLVYWRYDWKSDEMTLRKSIVDVPIPFEIATNGARPMEFQKFRLEERLQDWGIGTFRMRLKMPRKKTKM